MVMAEGERPLRNFRNLLDWSVERQDHPPGDESLQSADEVSGRIARYIVVFTLFFHRIKYG